MNAPLAMVRYDAMVHAIAECHRYDEAKDIRDKAAALETYARQARNTDAERKAADVRLRAERRAGELLKELARTTPADRAETANAKMGRSSSGAANVSPYAEALEVTGTSRQTANRYQALANVPQETFDAHLANPVRKPTTNAIISAARDPQPKIDDAALWIWGRARDFERDGVADKSPEELLGGMTETMRADMVRIVPAMVEFFQRFEEALSEPA